MVHVRWHGHSCFELRGKAKVLIDPHDGSSLGLPPPDVDPDVVLISHLHDDHAGGKSIFAKPGVAILDKPVRTEVKGVEIRGVRAFHDDVQGKRLGENVVYVVVLDGIRFCHLGDIGHPLTPQQLGEVGEIDVLFVSTGRDLQLAENNIDRLHPKIVIPMHYHVEGIIFPYFRLLDVEEYLKGKKNVRRFGGSSVEILREDLPLEREIYLLKL